MNSRTSFRLVDPCVVKNVNVGFGETGNPYLYIVTPTERLKLYMKDIDTAISCFEDLSREMEKCPKTE